MNWYTRNDEKGEGASLVDGNEMNVVKSECALCMICVCHNSNTCKKDRFLEDKVGDMPDDDPYKKILQEIFN